MSIHIIKLNTQAPNVLRVSLAKYINANQKNFRCLFDTSKPKQNYIYNTKKF